MRGGEEGFERLRAAWRAQIIEAPSFRPEALQQAARRFERQIWRRNLREYLAGALVVPVFGWMALTEPLPLVRLGALAVVAGALGALGSLAWRGSTRPLPPEALASECLAWRRQELERQHALLASIWRWYLGPLLPGTGLILLGRVLEAESATRYTTLGAVALLCAALFWGVGRMNLATARQLEAELAALREGDNVDVD